MTKQAPKEISFHTKEFETSDKSPVWYVGIGILLAAMLFAGYQSRNYTFMLAVIAIGVAIYRLANLTPKSHEIKINQKGVYWGKAYLPYHHLKSFWVTQTGEGVGLYFDRLNFKSTLHISIPDSKAEDVAVLLAQHLPFHFHKKEPISDRLGRLLGI